MFNAFKARSDSYLRRMLSYPETAPQIDWSHYRKNLTDASVVDQLEAAYKALNIVYPKDTLSHEVDAQQKQNELETQEFIKDSQLVIAEANKMLEKFKVMIPVKDMSEEEFTLTFPEWNPRWQEPSWWPHPETTPGLSKKQREEFMKPDGPPYSLRMD